MNFNLVEMYNGLLRFNKHILNFVPNKVGTNKKADYNWIRGNNGQDTDKAIRVLLLGGLGDLGSKAGSGSFYSHLVRSDYATYYGFFTTVKLD